MNNEVEKLLKKSFLLFQYKTTYKDIKKYLKILNNVIFDNKLSPFSANSNKRFKKRKVYRRSSNL